MPSAAAVRALLGLEPDDVVLVLLTISHPEIETIRVTNNNEDVLSNGNTFLAFPFDITLPPDSEDPGAAQLTIANVDRKIIGALEDITDPPDCEAQIVLASTPNIIEFEWVKLVLRSADADDMTVTAVVGQPVIDATPYPPVRVTQRDFPGLY
jgi:hypothetical protein